MLSLWVCFIVSKWIIIDRQRRSRQDVNAISTCGLSSTDQLSIQMLFGKDSLAIKTLKWRALCPPCDNHFLKGRASPPPIQKGESPLQLRWSLFTVQGDWSSIWWHLMRNRLCIDHLGPCRLKGIRFCSQPNLTVSISWKKFQQTKKKKENMWFPISCVSHRYDNLAVWPPLSLESGHHRIKRWLAQTSDM